MSTQHTPGPWVYHVVGHFLDYEIRGPKSEDIASVNPSDGADDPEFYPAEANARLIAAAPDLLNAVKAALPILLTAEEGLPRLRERIQVCRDAIAKAEGRP